MYYVRKNNKVLFLLFDILGLLISYITTFNFNISSRVSVYLAMILVVISTAIIVMGEEYSTIGERGYLVWCLSIPLSLFHYLLFIQRYLKESISIIFLQV